MKKKWLFHSKGKEVLVLGVQAHNSSAYAEAANEMYEYIVSETKKYVPSVKTGIFGADMKVELLNDGPFTIIMDSEELGY